MFRKTLLFLLVAALAFPGTAAFAKLDVSKVEPFLGNWALFLPGGGAGWLNVRLEHGNMYMDGDMLWGGGSVVPLSSLFLQDDTLVAIRGQNIDFRDKKGKLLRRFNGGRIVTAKVDGDEMSLTTFVLRRDQMGYTTEQYFSGKKIPPPPPAPNMETVQYDDPIRLFNGKNLDGWRLTNPNHKNGWSANNGVLINNPVQIPGQHAHYGNLRTEREFEDFTLELDVNVPKGGNSGIYLRGIYEVQVADTYGRPLDSHHMGGLYSRISPKASAEKPAGEWQHFKITLWKRHLTVELNGVTIIDNEPVYGVTGGALTADEFQPGPIYLQGDHTGVKYRNIILTPIDNSSSAGN